MNDHIRTFIAVDLNETARKALVKAQSEFKKLQCNVKWVEPENIHLTLKFLGAVESEKINEIIQRIHAQGTLITDITSDIGDIKKVGEENAKTAGDISAATEEQTSAMEEISATSGRLTGLVESLKVTLSEHENVNEKGGIVKGGSILK